MFECQCDYAGCYLLGLYISIDWAMAMTPVMSVGVCITDRLT